VVLLPKGRRKWEHNLSLPLKMHELHSCQRIQTIPTMTRTQCYIELRGIAPHQCVQLVRSERYSPAEEISNPYKGSTMEPIYVAVVIGQLRKSAGWFSVA